MKIPISLFVYAIQWLLINRYIKVTSISLNFIEHVCPKCLGYLKWDYAAYIGIMTTCCQSLNFPWSCFVRLRLWICSDHALSIYLYCSKKFRSKRSCFVCLPFRVITLCLSLNFQLNLPCPSSIKLALQFMQICIFWMEKVCTMSSSPTHSQFLVVCYPLGFWLDSWNWIDVTSSRQRIKRLSDQDQC